MALRPDDFKRILIEKIQTRFNREIYEKATEVREKTLEMLKKKLASKARYSSIERFINPEVYIFTRRVRSE
ncbi:MAG: hypothetical protein QW096_11955 [Thermofilaceae archaeon]